MKHLIAVLSVIALCFNVNAQEKKELPAPSFFQGTLTEANELAISEERSFLVILYKNEDNELMKYFSEEVFTDSNLLKIFERDYVCLKEQVDSEKGKVLIKQFGPTQFPIILFVSTEGELLHEIVAKIEPDQMIDELRRKVFNN